MSKICPMNPDNQEYYQRDQNNTRSYQNGSVIEKKRFLAGQAARMIICEIVLQFLIVSRCGNGIQVFFYGLREFLVRGTAFLRKFQIMTCQMSVLRDKVALRVTGRKKRKSSFFPQFFRFFQFREGE